jgi:hypothetical protein
VFAFILPSKLPVNLNYKLTYCPSATHYSQFKWNRVAQWRLVMGIHLFVTVVSYQRIIVVFAFMILKKEPHSITIFNKAIECEMTFRRFVLPFIQLRVFLSSHFLSKKLNIIYKT